MKEMILRKCLKCGAMIEVLKDCTCDNCGIKCCGETMKEIIANSVDASVEKHKPMYEVVGDEMVVKVDHVMEQEHYIEWIAMVSEDKVIKVILKPEQQVECKFEYVSGAKIYAYCNKHGLWENEVV